MKRIKILFSILSIILLQACNNNENPTSPLSITGKSGTITTIAGQGPSSFDYAGDGGIAIKAKLDFITSVAVDASKNVYFTGMASNTIRKINSSNSTIQTISGVFLGWNSTDANPLEGDNGPANLAHLHAPLAVTVDASGNILMIDDGNAPLREIKATDGIIHKIAGTEPLSSGYAGDGSLATAAAFDNPYSIATDANGNIYIADSENNAIRVINRSTGIINTLAGMGPDHRGYTGDNGPATSATLNRPMGVAVDSKGNIYVSDSGNHVIRKISNGTISTIAGTGVSGFSGDGQDGLSAKLNDPRSIAIDGNLIYFVDSGNNVIRKIDGAGKISTYVGTGAAGYSGDGGPATAATISSPWGIAVDKDGNLYIADTNNASVRVVIK